MGNYVTWRWRVEVPITDHLRDYAPNLEKYKVVQISPCRKIGIMRTAIFLVIIFLKLKLLCIFGSHNLSWTYYQCLASAVIAHFKCSFFFALALKLGTCVMALLVPTWSKLWHPIVSRMIEIVAPYRFPMGSRLALGASSIVLRCAGVVSFSPMLAPCIWLVSSSVRIKEQMSLWRHVFERDWIVDSFKYWKLLHTQ